MSAEQRGPGVDNRPTFGGLPIRGSSLIGGMTVLLELAGKNEAVIRAGGQVSTTDQGVTTTLRYQKGRIPVIQDSGKK